MKKDEMIAEAKKQLVKFQKEIDEKIGRAHV